MAESAGCSGVCQCHSFSDIEELGRFRSQLTTWYDIHKRDLPWRTLAAEEKDANKRAYAVWVSEVMLQQTQVATVIDYYNRWMKKWPTVEDLAAATLDEVRTVWSGLGYYSRGQRLWEGAKKVVEELHGEIPTTADHLMETLPGVGRYTAGAVASIAFRQVTGVVDGNVMRVLSRHRLIGAETNKQHVIQHFWQLANTSVDPGRPGDFNQALMELGATVCTPKSPQCHSCPLQSSCGAFDKVNRKQSKVGLHKYSQPCREESDEREAKCGKLITREHCPLCLAEGDFEPTMGVANYPRKSKKKEPPVEHFAVAVLENSDGQLLLRQRPQTGLLAGLWEFPSASVEGRESKEEMWEKIEKQMLGEECLKQSSCYIGQVVHKFSHIHYYCHCWHVKGLFSEGKSLTIECSEKSNWIDKSMLTQQPISTLVKKIYQLLKRPKLRPCPGNEEEKSAKRQKTIEQFFQKSV